MTEFAPTNAGLKNSTSAAETEQQLISAALARFVSFTLPPVAAGLGLLYLLFAAAHYLLIAPPVQLPMTVTALASSLLLLLLALRLRLRPVNSAWAHFWAAVVAGFVLVNSWLHMVLTHDMLQSTNFMLLIVGVGFFFLSRRWFASFVFLIVLAWASALYWFAIPLDDIVHFCFGLVSAGLLASLAHYARRARLVRLSRLHHQDQKKAAELQLVLESIQVSEAALRTSEAQYRALSQQLEDQAEALRVANQALATAAKLKDEFLASMSHELRTPLTTILGLTESLTENIYGPISPQQHQPLQYVLESGRHLLDLINDILDVAKTEAGQHALELVPTDVRMIAEASIRFIQQRAAEKGLSVNFALDEQVNLLLADERRLKQILINLLNNAVKFTGEEGEIGLQIVGNPAQQCVHFTVWDTGIGIPIEQMTRLFKPFIQLDSRLSRRYGGSGLGLVLVYRMVEMHGGSVGVVSTPDEGSRFTVTLPWRVPRRQRDVNTQVRTTPPAQSLPCAPKVLILDAHPLSREWIKEIAVTAGYEPITADDTTDLYVLVAKVQPALILVDMQFPNIDLPTLVQGVRRDAPQPAPQIIGMSALALPALAEQAKAAAVDAYLEKPVTLHALLLHREEHGANAGDCTGKERNEEHNGHQ